MLGVSDRRANTTQDQFNIWTERQASIYSVISTVLGGPRMS